MPWHALLHLCHWLLLLQEPTSLPPGHWQQHTPLLLMCLAGHCPSLLLLLLLWGRVVVVLLLL